MWLLGALLLASTGQAEVQEESCQDAAAEPRPARVISLPIPGDKNAEVVFGPLSSRRAVIYLHGVCGNVLAFQSWAQAVHRHGTLIALRGDKLCKYPPKTQWSWDPKLLDRRIQQALTAVSDARGVPLDTADVVVIGYSQGASRAELLAWRFPERYRRVVLIAPPKEPKLERLRKAHSVMLIAGQRDAKRHILEGERALRKAHKRVRYDELPRAKHGEYGPRPGEVMTRALDWLLVPVDERGAQTKDPP